MKMADVRTFIHCTIRQQDAKSYRIFSQARSKESRFSFLPSFILPLTDDVLMYLTDYHNHLYCKRETQLSLSSPSLLLDGRGNVSRSWI